MEHWPEYQVRFLGSLCFGVWVLLGFFGGLWGFCCVFYILRKLWKIPLKKALFILGGIRFISIISRFLEICITFQEKQHYFHF